MATVPVYVGIDYHTAAVQLCILDPLGKVLANRPCPNDSAAIRELVRPFAGDPHVAIEACTGAANLAEELVQRFGWSVDLAHPGFVARRKQDPDKTDFTDARLLADLERVGYLPRVWLAPEDVRELRRLARYRQQLAGERKTLKLRVGALLRDGRVVQPALRPWTVAWLRWLRQALDLSAQTRWIVDRQLARLAFLGVEITAVEHRLRQLTADDTMVQELLAMKGIGLVTAVTIRAEVGRFDRFRSGKQLARYCGLSPRNASSGRRQADAGLIKAGNPQLRTVIIEAAHRLMRCQGRWRELGLALRGRGKAASLVIGAVANRWVRWLYHQLRPIHLAA